MAEVVLDKESTIIGFDVSKQGGTFKVTYRDTYSENADVLFQTKRTESFEPGNAPQWVQDWLPEYAAWITDPESNPVPTGIVIEE